jgi:hypothetical protein
MFKSELLRAIQHEIMQHDFDCFMDDSTPGVRVVVPGCPKCRKTLYTTSNFIDHINNDVLPKLIDGLSGDAGEPPHEDYLDADYWADPERSIRRRSGEQETIFKATSACSKAEWLMLLEGLGMEDPVR